MKLTQCCSSLGEETSKSFCILDLVHWKCVKQDTASMPELQPLDPTSYLAQGIQGQAYVTNVADVEASICPPPCPCIDCQTSFYTLEEHYKPCFWYRGRISDRDAERIAAEYVRDAKQDRQYLQERLASHGDIIVNRWKKKSREKREALLVQTAPELYESRWIIPRYCYMPESKLVGLGGRTQMRRSQLLLHWLNRDILKSNPSTLFALLHNRTAYPPQDWAAWACIVCPLMSQ